MWSNYNNILFCIHIIYQKKKTYIQKNRIITWFQDNILFNKQNTKQSICNRKVIIIIIIFK